MKRIITIFLFLGWGVSCTVNQGPRISALSQDAVVLAFGDSLTFGSGASSNESYPAVLESLIKRKVINSGIPGEVTSQAVQRLIELLDKHQPQLLILCHGGNDLLRKEESSTIVQNLRLLIQMARTRGIDVVLIGVPQPNLLLDVPDFYGELAEEFMIPYEGKILREIFRAPGLKSDPIHPNANGYRKLAERLATLLKESGAL